ncbi:oocyte-secreted protein 2 [Peromyscus californicus insignis]|uniref:oocyte-secreted protein 2 n=1 Tax=Peromyscus californicus insignis TaxID=564181 RepID=UPI0022A77586|nr:oocyte-secreted protein 2 [Peromyscus californicus insignis]
MKVSMALEVLVLFPVLVWPCAGNIEVVINCSIDWVMVFVSTHSKNRIRPYVFADELVLGQGCSATQIHTYQYDFVYPVHDCGIRTKVISKDTLCFETELYFMPRSTSCEPQTIPLQCSASRTPVSPDEDPKVGSNFFMVDFEAMPKELGLLNVHQSVSS